MLAPLIDNQQANNIFLELQKYCFQDYSFFFPWNHYIFCLGLVELKRISLEPQPPVTRNELFGIVLGKEDIA